MIRKIVVSLSISLAAVSCSHADNRLFPTDILRQGEVDVRALVDHDTNSANINFNTNSGRESQDITAESIQARYGLGANLHVGLSLNYRTQDVVHTDYTNPPAHNINTSSQGWQNPTLWATYGIINDTTKPFSMNAELLVRPKMTDNASAYSGRLSTGWKSSDTLRLYAAFSLTTNRDPVIADSSSVTAGAYKAVSENVTLIPHASYTRYRATDVFSAQTQYGIGLSSDVLIFRNTYLIPDISLYRNSAGDSKNTTFHRDSSANGRAITLSLYRLF
jgi:hypothetical protein